MAIIHVTVEGLTPLLMCSAAGMIGDEFSAKDLKAMRTTGEIPKAEPKVPVVSKQKEKPSLRDQLEAACYRMPDRTMGFPASAFERCMVDAAKGQALTDESGKRDKVGLSTRIQGMFRLEPQGLIPLLRDGKPIRGFVPDVRTALNHNTRPPARIVVARPLIELPWQACFDIVWRGEWSFARNFPEIMRDFLLTKGGIVIGVGAFRPQCKGWFGQFRVLEFEEE